MLYNTYSKMCIRDINISALTHSGVSHLSSDDIADIVSCQFGLVGLDQHSYSTPGPVSAWMGDRLWTGKPPQCRTRHPGLLSLSHLSVGRQNAYPAKVGGVNTKQAHRVIH